MQLLILELVDVSISVCLSAAHVIGIVLERNGAMVSSARVLGWHKAVLLSALMVRGGALVVRVVSGQTPVTNLPQGAVIFVVVWGHLIALKTIREWCGGFRLLLLLGRKGADVALGDSIPCCPNLCLRSTHLQGPV
jgi:hypothetical protein